MAGRIELDVTARGASGPRGKSPEQGPMRVLLVGNFSGRNGSAGAPSLATRPTHRVDIDNLGAVMQRLAPRVPAGDSLFEAEDIDDFHPDALYARLPVFAGLRQLRRRLQDPAQFAQAAADLGVPLTSASAAANREQPGSGADLLAGLLGGRPAAATPQAATGTPGGVDAFIRSIVAPHVLPDHGAQQAELTASVDQAIAEQMRQVLHAPEFQALECAWRGVQWLVSSLELDDQLQLHLFDATRDELLADVVAAHGKLADTGLHKALVDRWRGVPGASGWSLLVGLYSFGPTDADVGLLAALGLLAAQVGAPWLAAGHTALALSEPAALAGWQALRRSEAAPWIGLSAPRVLLRAPYGKRSDPITAFAFEEFSSGVPDHEHFLWGPASMAVGLLMARAYAARGWAFEPGDEREVGDLPAYTFERDGEKEMQACAEDYLGEQAGQALLSAGLMPLLSHKHRNAVTVMRFQSIAEPARLLAGLARS